MLPFAAAIIELEEDRSLLRPQQPQESATIVAAIGEQAADAQADLAARVEAEEPSMKLRISARRAAMAVGELRRALRSWNEYYAEWHPEFGWWLREPFASTDALLAGYAEFLQEVSGEVATAKGGRGGETANADQILGDPIGRDALFAHLKNDMIPYTPEELVALAEQEWAWCEREMLAAARELGFEGPTAWNDALAAVSEMHAPPGGQPDVIKRLAEEAIEFLEERELVTIPPLAKESWRMEMMSVERQVVNPFFTGGEVISVSYPSEAMSHEDKLSSMRSNATHLSHATVQHELIPGHHLQLFMLERYQSHRQLFRTPFLVEGWALHWEMLLWDQGFHATPEDKVGALFWRSHRCARIIFSLKYELGEMTAAEAIDFLHRRVGHELRNAIAEVRRSVSGDYPPLYQAAYMLGGLQMRALHADLCRGPSPSMTDRQFHDAVLREGAIPLEMIRASLTDQVLGKEFVTNWRFCEADPPFRRFACTRR